MKRRSPEEAEEVLRASGLEPLIPYPGSTHAPWKSRCVTCGSERAPKLTNLLQRADKGGRGCVCSPDKYTPHPEGLSGVPFHLHSGYEVFADGSIRGPSGWVNPFQDKDGYLRFNVYGLSQQSVHRAVCFAFHGGPPSEAHGVAHLDGNKLNNRASNLKWCTQPENESHKVAHGTATIGEAHPMAKLSEQDVRFIRERASKGTPADVIAKDYPQVHYVTVRSVIRKATWRGVK